MEIIEISDEEIYNANKDTQNTQVSFKKISLKSQQLKINQHLLQILPVNSDSSSDNESIKEIEMAYFTKNLGVPTVIYSTVPIEYPATSSDGIATVFSIQGWKNHMDAFNDVS